jgi:ABC-type transporter Mla subunit MlaD
MAQTADLNSTISALQSGLTSLPAEAALANIESWQEQLQGAAPEIASTLGELKTALSSGNANAQTIAQALTKLGSQTSDAGTSAGGDAGSQLQQLGQMLTQAASSLS